MSLVEGLGHAGLLLVGVVALNDADGLVGDVGAGTGLEGLFDAGLLLLVGEPVALVVKTYEM